MNRICKSKQILYQILCLSLYVCCAIHSVDPTGLSISQKPPVDIQEDKLWWLTCPEFVVKGKGRLFGPFFVFCDIWSFLDLSEGTSSLG